MFQTQLYQQYKKPARIILLVLVTGFISYKLLVAYNLDELIKGNKGDFSIGSWWILAFAFALMLVNWGLEALKWKSIINKYESVSYGVALKAVFSGVTLGIITPNQIGDFAGRVMHLEVLDKIKGSLATVIGNTAQVLVTCFFGSYALMVFGSRYFDSPLYSWILIALIAILFIGFILMGKIYAMLPLKNLPLKVAQILEVFGDYSPKELGFILLLSAIRYATYLIQYLLLLQFFRVEIEPYKAVACIVGTFFVQSVFPSFLLLEMGLRGASALWFLTIYSDNVAGILLSAYSLWMVNMLLPALLGLYFIYRIK